MTTVRNALLVTGASGHLGRSVIECLLAGAAKGRPIIATTRSPDKLADFAARGVEVRAADFEQGASLDDAFKGADRMLLISTDALDRPGRRLEQHVAAIAAAKKAGVRHVVYTSLTNPGPESLVTIAPDHRETEAALAEASFGHTILRNNFYTEYLLPGLPYAVKSGGFANAYGNGGVGYVSREDCARIAGAALAADFDGRAVHDVTGPAAITQTELAAIVSELTGRKVTYTAIDGATSKAHLVAAGLPAPVADLLVSFELAGAKGQLAVASTAVETLIGKKPISVRDFLTKNVEALTA
ncbi:MAG TPA: SDR family oxidoreductase [Polyangiaceae bacterium]|jgi:NAD(P)H dehydrogenase (quinone)|nr:SDR family oxidoreductase [Polyangiaceae bacterium]